MGEGGEARELDDGHHGGRLLHGRWDVLRQIRHVVRVRQVDRIHRKKLQRLRPGT